MNEVSTEQKTPIQASLPKFSPWAILALIFANLWPIYGVYFLGWNIANILVLYWSENLIIGFINIFKMRVASGKLEEGETEVSISFNDKEVDPSDKKVLIKFYLFEFLIFMLAHGFVLLIIIVLGLVPKPNLGWPAFTLPFLLLGFSHSISYWLNFLGRGEYKMISTRNQLVKPFGRIIIMHSTIIGAAFIALTFKSAQPVIILMILSKILLDITFHLRERKSYLFD